MASNENTEKTSVAASAVETTTGGIKGFLTGSFVGAAASAAIGALIGAVAGPAINYFSGTGANLFSGNTAADLAKATARTAAAQAAANQEASGFVNGVTSFVNGVPNLINSMIPGTEAAQAAQAAQEARDAATVLEAAQAFGSATSGISGAIGTTNVVAAGQTAVQQAGQNAANGSIVSNRIIAGLDYLFGTNAAASTGPIPDFNLPTNLSVTAAPVTPIAPVASGTPILSAIGIGAGIGAAIGSVVGAITGFFGGAKTGWRNANPDKDGLETEQAKQMEFAKGVAQGVTMAKIEDMEQQQMATTVAWTDRVGGRKDPSMLFQDQINQQKLALKTIEPMGTA